MLGGQWQIEGIETNQGIGRTQAEQFKLNRIIHAKRCQHPNFRIEFNKRVVGVTQDADSVTVRFEVTHGVATGRFLFAEHPAVTGAYPLSLLWTTNDAPARIDGRLRVTNVG